MNDIRNDKNLQEAVNRREQRLEPMPSDLNDRLMKRLSTSPREEGEGFASSLVCMETMECGTCCSPCCQFPVDVAVQLLADAV